MAPTEHTRLLRGVNNTLFDSFYRTPKLPASCCLWRQTHKRKFVNYITTPLIYIVLWSSLAAVMEVPSSVFESVLVKSESMPLDAVAVKGFDFNNGIGDVHSLLSTYITTGFQATHFGRAVKEIEKMVVICVCASKVLYFIQLDKKAEKVPEGSLKPHLSESGDRLVDNCTIFLGYTSNLISSGIRETIRYLVEHNMVSIM